MTYKDFRNLDFDHLLNLAEKDPVRFEDMRQEAIDDYISTLPEERQVHMRRLQWRIDQERRNRSPLSACVRISGLMWENMVGPKGLLGFLQDTSSFIDLQQNKENSCRVLEFPLRPS
jgi:hypothetical protein